MKDLSDLQHKSYNEKRSDHRIKQHYNADIRVSLQTCNSIKENREKLQGLMNATQSKFKFRSFLGLLAVLDQLEISSCVTFEEAFEIYSSFFDNTLDKILFRDILLSQDCGIMCC